MAKTFGNFTFNGTEIEGVYIIDVKKYGDNRGYFMETYKEADDAGESHANKARDFGSLLAGKVAGGKKKCKRILGFKIYTAGGGNTLDAGS